MTHKADVGAGRSLQLSYEVPFKEVEGVIEAVSPQGNVLYVVVRRIDKYVKDIINDIEVPIKGGIIGNIHNIRESELTHAEILIPTDIDLASYFGKLETLRGKKVFVQTYNGRPRLARLAVTDMHGQARVIDAEVIRSAREASPTKSITGKVKELIQVLTGQSSSIIDAVLDDKYSQDKIDKTTGVYRYGDVSTWQNATDGGEDANINGVDMTKHSNAKIVTSLPISKLKSYLCHQPTRAFSAK